MADKRLSLLEVKYKLSLCDPDYLVDVLEISSQELISKFEERVEEYIENEYELEDLEAYVQNEEGYNDGPLIEEEWETPN